MELSKSLAPIAATAGDLLRAAYRGMTPEQRAELDGHKGEWVLVQTSNGRCVSVVAVDSNGAIVRVYFDVDCAPGAPEQRPARVTVQ